MAATTNYATEAHILNPRPAHVTTAAPRPTDEQRTRAAAIATAQPPPPQRWRRVHVDIAVEVYDQLLEAARTESTQIRSVSDVVAEIIRVDAGGAVQRAREQKAARERTRAAQVIADIEAKDRKQLEKRASASGLALPELVAPAAAPAG